MKYPNTDRLRALFDYNRDSGVFTWRWRPRYDFKTISLWVQHEKLYCGKRAGHHSTDGYRYLRVDGHRIGEHRLAWLYVTGELPEQIDHINGDTQDNRFVNLRDVSNAANARNQKLRSTNTSGFVGVRRENGKWASYIHHDGSQIRLGRFSDIDAAIAARKSAETRFGFHPNHGRKM